jgi:NADH dehydrogenase FAD-containing subunit
MTARSEVLVVGGGYAGLIAAGRIASNAPGARVTLIDGADRFRQRIRMHERLAGGSPLELPYASLLERRGIRFVRGWVEGIHLRAQQVTVQLPGGEPRRIDYDHLVLAAGSRTADGPGVPAHAVRVDDEPAIDAARMRLPDLAARHGRVIVVGGGLTGIESAAELSTRYPGLRVSLVTADRIGASWSPAAAAHFYDFFARHAVEILEGVRIDRAEQGGVLLESGEMLHSDLTLWCAGFQASPLAWDAGLPVEADGRVAVDGTLRPPGYTSIFIAGDLAAVRFGGDALRMSCQAALPMGAQAAANVVRSLRGEALEPIRFGFSLRCVSLGRRDGVVQFTDPDDRPTGRVLTGRAAAFMKERICSMTSTVVDWETRRGIHAYRWAMPARADEPTAAPELREAS